MNVKGNPVTKITDIENVEIVFKDERLPKQEHMTSRFD